MYRGWLQIGHTELANTARTVAYMENGIKNLTAEVVTDDSWPMMPWFLGRDDEWQTPALDDDCPWAEPTNSASLEFAGVWPMSVEGLDSTPLEREVIDAATDGGGFGVQRTPPRVITVEALVIGQTPAGLEFGMGWLNEVLRGAGGEGARAQPRDLSFMASAPPFDAEMTAEQAIALGTAETRMVSSVVLTSPPEVDERIGTWAPENRGATINLVTFELTAGVPWVWQQPQTLVDNIRPIDGELDSVIFDNANAGMNAATEGILVDPQSTPLSQLPRPVTPAAALGLYPMDSVRSTWQLQAGRIPSFFESIPTITIRTGIQDERAVRLQWVEGVPTGDDAVLSDSIGEALIRYIPANTTFSLDAITGKATAITPSGENLDASPVTTGRMGGPWRAPILTGDRTYTLIIDVEDTVDPEMTVQVDATVRST